MGLPKTAIICSVYVILLASSPSVMTHSAQWSHQGQASLNTLIDTAFSTNVTVFVLNLPGIPSSMGNASRFLEGIRDATRNGTYDSSNSYQRIFTQYPGSDQTNIMFKFAQVNDWVSYKNVVLNGNNFVLINSHGSYLPVPQGYSPDQWFDQILGAISNRYATWVHIAGYPFYNAWGENSGIISQGGDLFLKLASYAGWSAAIAGNPSRLSAHATDYYYGINRWPNPVPNETSWQFVNYGGKVTTTGYTNYTLSVRGPGPGFHGFYQVVDGNVTYYAGVAARVDGTTTGTYGLYVHVVPGPFGSDSLSRTGIDLDYGRGLLSVLMALEWHIEETVGGIKLAENRIVSAEQEDRTQGLDRSREYLSKAKSEFNLGHNLEAWSEAYLAAASANNATTPWWTQFWTQAWPYAALIGGIIGISLFAALGTIIPGLLAATVGRLGNRIGWVEKTSRFIRKKFSRQRKSDPRDSSSV